MSPRPTLVVIAKQPLAGRVKTRLCPPCSPVEAAQLAAAALADTLGAVAAVPAARRILAFDGSPSARAPAGFELLPQAGGGLDRRLAAVFEAVGGPSLIVGMDTPQLTAELLDAALSSLREPGHDAVLGPASDGGYWAIGLRHPRGDAVAGVPMSVPWTAAAQRRRFQSLGLRWSELRELRDVDRFEDARAVAAACPGSGFAAQLHGIESRWRSMSPPSRAGVG